MDIRAFVFALQQFKLQDKSVASTKVLLKETKELRARFPEADVPLSTMIANLETRLAIAAAQETPSPSTPVGQQPHAEGEQLTDFRKKLLPRSEYQTFKDVVGYADVKRRLCEQILQPLLDPGYFGGGVKTGVVLYGPGGTGKSLFAKALAGEAKTKDGKYLPTFFITYADIGSKFYGEAEKNMRNLIETAGQMADQAGGAIIVFDEADALFGSESEVGQSVVNEFKARHDFINSKNIATIAATNHPGKLKDPGLKRRLGDAIYVGMPRTAVPPYDYSCLGKPEREKNEGNDLLALLQFYVRHTGTCGGAKSLANVVLPTDLQNTVDFEKAFKNEYKLIEKFTNDNIRAWVARAELLVPNGRQNYRSLYYCPSKTVPGTWDPVEKSTGPECRKYGDPDFTLEKQKRICWLPVGVNELKEVLKQSLIAPSTDLRDIYEYLDYAKALPDDKSVARIEEDKKKFEDKKPKKEEKTETAAPAPVQKAGWLPFFSA